VRKDVQYQQAGLDFGDLHSKKKYFVDRLRAKDTLFGLTNKSYAAFLTLKRALYLHQQLKQRFY